MRSRRTGSDVKVMYVRTGPGLRVETCRPQAFLLLSLTQENFTLSCGGHTCSRTFHTLSHILTQATTPRQKNRRVRRRRTSYPAVGMSSTKAGGVCVAPKPRKPQGCGCARKLADLTIGCKL